MKRMKRLFYYLLINMLVSACTTLAVLNYWERTHPQSSELNPLALLPTAPFQLPVITEPPVEAVPTLTPQHLAPYVVQAGDSLGAIAIEVGSTVDELMRINALTDPSGLGIGQVLYVPAPPHTATPSADPAVGPTQTIAAQPPASEGLVAIANVFGAGDLATERVRLVRSGDADVVLEGWQLLDVDGNIYTFPRLTLFEGGAVDVYTSAGRDGAASLHWGLGVPVWTAGEIVTLVDQGGSVQAVYQVP